MDKWQVIGKQSMRFKNKFNVYHVYTCKQMTKIVVVRCDVSGYEYSSNIHEQFHETVMNIVPKMFLKYSCMNSFMRIS